MKIKSTVTLVAETEIDEEEYKDGDRQMESKEICEQVQSDIEEDWQTQLDNYDFQVSEVKVEQVQ